jgi:hypothetical protein
MTFETLVALNILLSVAVMVAVCRMILVETDRTRWRNSAQAFRESRDDRQERLNKLESVIDDIQSSLERVQ